MYKLVWGTLHLQGHAEKDSIVSGFPEWCTQGSGLRSHWARGQGLLQQVRGDPRPQNNLPSRKHLSRLCTYCFVILI